MTLLFNWQKAVYVVVFLIWFVASQNCYVNKLFQIYDWLLLRLAV